MVEATESKAPAATNGNIVVSEPGKVNGVRMRLGTEEYIVPALNVCGFIAHKDLIEKIQSDSSMTATDRVRGITEIVLCAMQRNYPHVNMEMMLDVVDVGNMESLFLAVMGMAHHVNR